MLGAQHQFLVGMHSSEVSYPVINIVVALTKVEINNIDRIYFTNLQVFLAYIDIFSYSFRGAIKHSLKIVKLPVVLQFNNNQLIMTILGQNVNTIKLIGFAFLVAFAFQDSIYFNILVQQFTQKTFKNPEIGLVTQQAFNSPVK